MGDVVLDRGDADESFGCERPEPLEVADKRIGEARLRRERLLARIALADVAVFAEAGRRAQAHAVGEYVARGSDGGAGIGEPDMIGGVDAGPELAPAVSFSGIGERSKREKQYRCRGEACAQARYGRTPRR